MREPVTIISSLAAAALVSVVWACAAPLEHRTEETTSAHVERSAVLVMTDPRKGAIVGSLQALAKLQLVNDEDGLPN